MEFKDFFTNVRYRKVTWFFATIFMHLILWDVLLRKVPLVKAYAVQTSITRWRKIARQFRVVAIELGGLLIKLGQFLSIRVDILPADVVQELAGLQDEVPPHPWPAIKDLLERELSSPLEQIFTEFDPEPLAAASLAQAYHAKLEDGSKVVVKVQRPDIHQIVEVDLAATSLALGWLKYYPKVSQRVNLDWLADEFALVTRRELDYLTEGKNIERFAKDFSHEKVLYLPKVYWEYSTLSVLTMEDVSYIRISDFTALDEADIDRSELAKKLYNIYMQQVFKTNFVHVDAHPGNLFIRPLPRLDHLNGGQARPYQIIFIDFGMVATVPQRLRAALRDYAIALGMRNARGIVEAYDKAGMLLPEADKQRLEEAHRDMFDRFWGLRMGQMRDMAWEQTEELLVEYKDLINEAPFQFQADMLFILRAIGLLSGLTTSLDDNFDPWTETIPFAEELAREELQNNWQEWLREALKIATITAGMPSRLDKILTEAENGALPLETKLAPQSRRTIRQLEDSIHRLTWAVASVGMLLAGVLLRNDADLKQISLWLMILAGGFLWWKVLR